MRKSCRRDVETITHPDQAQVGLAVLDVDAA
jgi:hypothetical protein